MKIIPSLLLLSLGFVMLSCSPKNSQLSPQEIVDKCIQAHGGELYSHSQISFKFRDRRYRSKKLGGEFEYERSFIDSLGNEYVDILTNQGFVRKINGDTVLLPQERVNAFSNSVNSVHYFNLLPFPLNDVAVIKSYVGEAKILGEPYYKVAVRFSKEQGGEDFEDQFLYWVHAKNFSLDYLAYSYATDGGGIRFRKATNQRMINGIRIQNYVNYQPSEGRHPDLNVLDSLFEHQALQEVSIIEQEDVSVDIL